MDESKEKTSVSDINLLNIIAVQMINDNETNAAINNINDNMKRKVEFQDGNVVIIKDKEDIDHILLIRDQISRLIEAFNFDAIKAIVLTYESYYIDFLNNKRVKYVSNPKFYSENILNNLKNMLQENIFTMDKSKFRNIVDVYVCDFLLLDHSFFDKYQNIQNETFKSTKDVLNVKEIEESVPKELENKANDKVALFENAAIYKGKNNLLYGGPKVGKSYFSIEVAKNEKIKKPCFILLEDYSGDQEKRYSTNLKNKMISLVNLKDFDEIYKKEMNRIEKLADDETIKDFSIKGFHHFKTLKRQNYVEMGIIKNIKDKLDRIAVIEKIIINEIKDGTDFICIDSLKALVEKNTHFFNRSHIRRLLEQVSKNHITFLLINHTTSDQKSMAITDDLRNTFDNTYKLEMKKRNDYIEMTLIEEEARDNECHIIKFKRTISDNYIVEHEIINSEVSESIDLTPHKKNVKYFIKEILADWPSEYIEFEILYSKLQEKTNKGKDKANIEKILKELENEDIIARKDGITWKGGIRIKGTSSETNKILKFHKDN